MEIKTRWCKTGDESQIKLLFERVFGKEKGIAEWKWRFTNNPAQIRGHDLTRLSEANGQIAGQYTVMPIRVSVCGEEISAALSLDTMVDSDLRGRGLFVRLAEECYEEAGKRGVRFVYGFPNRNSAHGFFKRLKWRSLGAPPVMVRPAFLPLPSLSWVSVGEVENFGAEFNHLWAVCRKSPVMLVRDARYLRWRYLESPFHYVKKTAAIGKSLNAFCAGRVLCDWRIPIGFVADLLGSNTAAISTVLSHVCHDLRRQGAMLLSALCPDHSPYAPIFQRFGFVRLPSRLFLQPLFFGLRALECCTQSTARILCNMRNWHISWGDTDLV